MDAEMFLELDGLVEEFSVMQQMADNFTSDDILHQEESENFQRWRAHVTWLHAAIELKQARDLNRIATALEELVRR